MKKFLALVVMICAVMISSTASAADYWLSIYSDDNLTVYIDNDSIHRDYNYSDYVFCAFVKQSFSDAKRQKMIDWYLARGAHSRQIYNFSHTVGLVYFKLENGIKRIATMQLVAYTHTGEPISEMSFSRSSPEWNVVVPDSIGEQEFNIAYSRIRN